MASTLADKYRSNSQTKKRISRITNLASPKIGLKPQENNPSYNKTQELYYTNEQAQPEIATKGQKNSRVNSGYKSDFTVGNSLFGNQTYKLDQNFLNQLQMMGLPIIQDNEPNHSYPSPTIKQSSFTEILKIKAVNFAQQGQAIVKKAKIIEKPILEERKDPKKKKKNRDGTSINIEKSPDELRDDTNGTERNKNTFRKSFSTIKGPKLDMSGVNTDETVSDSETIERKIQSASQEKDLKSNNSSRKERATSGSPQPQDSRVYRNGEDLSTSSMLPKKNSNIRLGPLDSIKEVVPKKNQLSTLTNSKAAPINAASNLMAAHKASASSQNGPTNSNFNSPTQPSKYSQNMNSPSYQPTNDTQTFHSPQTNYKGGNYTANFASPPKQTIHSLLASNQHSKIPLFPLISVRNISPNMNRGYPTKGTFTLTTNAAIPSTQNSMTNSTMNSTAMQIQIQKAQAMSNSMGPTLSQVSASTNANSNIVTSSYSNPSQTPFSRQTTNSNVVILQEVKKKIYVPPPVSNKFKYYVGDGNNGELVVDIMGKRDWWEQTESFNTLFNFKWQQGQRGYKYERLVANPHLKQVVNHFEMHRHISTKDLLIKNLSVYCETNKINIFDLTPTTFFFDADDDANFDTDMQRFAKFFIKHDPNPNKYPRPDQSDKKNHNVFFNFDYRKKKSYAPPILQSSKKLSPYLKPKIHKTFIKGHNVWILKPTGFNRGVGIEVFNSLESLNQFLNNFIDGKDLNSKPKGKREEGDASSDEEEEKNPKNKNSKLPSTAVKSHTFVIQKYIEDLLTIRSRKFDIRVWSLVTHEMQLYFFKEGYLRMSSEEFTLTQENIENKFIHLTNNAVQKYSDNYCKFESGNQLSFDAFHQYCLDNNIPIDVKGKVIPRVKELIQISMESVKKQINPNDSKYAFEVFGYDFMIDTEGSVWLIEVNTNPCIELSSPLLAQLIPRMLDDAFKLTLDTLFPPPKRPQAKNNSTNNNTVKQTESKPAEKKPEPVVVETKIENEPENPVEKAKEIVEEVKSEVKSEVKNEVKNEGKSEVKIENKTEANETLNTPKPVIENIATSKVEDKDNESLPSSRSIDIDEASKKKPATSNLTFKVDGYPDDEIMW